MELFEAIRRDHRREGLSIRELAQRHRVHRRTVRQALASAVPPVRKPRTFRAPVLDPARPWIDAMLGLGRTHAGTHVLLLVRDLDIRIINAATGELLRQLTLDPNRNYQPVGRPPGPTKTTPRKRSNPEP